MLVMLVLGEQIQLYLDLSLTLNCESRNSVNLEDISELPNHHIGSHYNLTGFLLKFPKIHNTQGLKRESSHQEPL